MFSEFWNFFSNSIKFFNQILVLKTFYFIFLKTSLFMNFITLSLDLFEPWFFCCFPYFVSEFLFFVLFLILWMLVTVNKVTFSLRKTFITFSNILAKECGVYKTEFALLETFYLTFTFSLVCPLSSVIIIFSEACGMSWFHKWNFKFE